MLKTAYGDKTQEWWWVGTVVRRRQSRSQSSFSVLSLDGIMLPSYQEWCYVKKLCTC